MKIVIIAIAPAPHYSALYRRLAAEVPGLSLRVAYLHNTNLQPWVLSENEHYQVFRFGGDEPPGYELRQRDFAHHVRKGGRVVSFLDEQRPDAVIVAGYSDPCRVRVLTHLQRRGVRHFLTADSNVLLDTSAGLKRVAKRGIVRMVVRRVNGVLVFGRHGASYFRRYGVPAEKIFFMPAEPEYPHFLDPDPNAVADAAKRHGLSPERRRLLCCGRLIPLKLVDSVIKAFGRIADQRPRWDLLIIGDGPERPALEALVRQVMGPEAGRRVRFLGFVGDTKHLGACFNLCHASVLASRSEAWGLVVNEACAAGHALALSNVVGAHGDLLIDHGSEQNGVLFPPGDVEALTRALMTITDDSCTRRFGERSRAILHRWRTEAHGDPVRGFRAALGIGG